MNFTKNAGTVDRALRAIVGLVLIALALTGTIGAWGWIGVIPLVTAALATSGKHPIRPHSRPGACLLGEYPHGEKTLVALALTLGSTVSRKASPPPNLPRWRVPYRNRAAMY